MNDKIEDELWMWNTIKNGKITSLKEEIDDKYFLPEKPTTTLYHYTNASGFKGIILSESLWLTDINYVNDADELKYAQNLIREIIKDFEEEYSSYKMFFEKLNWLADPFENSFDIYISCFCEKGNLLSQWNNYDLYSIGFEAEKPFRVSPSTFTHPDKWYKATLRKVEYKEENQTEIIEAIVGGIFKLYKEELSSSDRKPEMVAQDYASVFANFITKYVLCFKDEIFEQEKEWRLIHIQQKRSNKNIKFRDTREYLIPYVEIELKAIDEEKFDEYSEYREDQNKPLTLTDRAEYVEANGSFPIKEVIIGPDPHHKIAENSAKKFLSKTEYQVVM